MSPGGKLGRKSERAVPPASGGAVVTRSTVDLIPHVRPRARKWLRPERRCTWGRGRRTCGLLALPTPCLPQRSPRLSHLLDICRCAKVAACGLQGALQAEPPSSRRCFASPTNLRSLNRFRRVKLSQGVGWGAENGSRDMRSLIFFRSDQGPLCYFQGPSLFTVTEIPNLTLP